MDLYIYKPSGTYIGEMIGIVDDYESLVFQKNFKTSGNFTIAGLSTERNRELLKRGNIVVINEKLVGRIHSVVFEYNEEGEERYEVTGYDLKGLLSHRINKYIFERNNIQTAK